jgi:dienelactone hydrolase
LTPKAQGRRPLGVFPHGHDPQGPETTAGVYADEAHQRRASAADRDVAVQAVKLGFVAIAPAVRGLATDGVPDLHGRHGKRDCRSHLMHCLLAGRTATGERVWDMQRILDWAFTLPEVDTNHTLMMGNSGGGMVTMFTAACDERIDRLDAAALEQIKSRPRPTTEIEGTLLGDSLASVPPSRQPVANATR